MLAGGAGDDGFHFRRGDGWDRITDATRGDRVHFGPGITADDLRVARDGQHLVLQLGDSADKLVLEGWFASAAPLRDSYSTTARDSTTWRFITASAR